MQMAVMGFSEPGLRARGDNRHRKEEEGEQEMDKKRALRCKSEQAVHVIPLILVLSILILYIFSHDPTEVSINGSGKEGPNEEPAVSATEKNAGAGAGVRASFLQAFPVNGHRILQEYNKLQRGRIENGARKNNSLNPTLKHKKRSLHRKSRILHMD
eukprot:TRINITY_DN29210_c0_g1_i1.p1 TRINITY_DN29210_c0_g1~~TRINITY_DN29210_c0_g1_i1.p1  ORF type:complete len:157 (-),score=35.24 TRINITY_DN29210_c0_g1_i1:27-497(-)